MKDSKRDYRHEYLRDSASSKAKLERAARNKARRIMEKKGRVRKGDGKDVDHNDGNPMNNRPSNWEIMSASKNRAKH